MAFYKHLQLITPSIKHLLSSYHKEINKWQRDSAFKDLKRDKTHTQTIILEAGTYHMKKRGQDKLSQYSKKEKKISLLSLVLVVFIVTKCFFNAPLSQKTFLELT